MPGRQQWFVFRPGPWLAVCLLGVVLSIDCDSIFNPAFVEVVAGTAEEPVATIQNATGHAPVLFVNKLRFSTQLTDFLGALSAERRLGNLEAFGGDLTNLRPRIRMQILITFENGNTLPFEFVSGDGVIEIERRDEDADEEDIPDPTEVPTDPTLTQNDLERLVATCDVARIEVVGDPQVFVPVFTRVIRIVVGDFGFRTRVLVRTDRPQFRPVLPDEVDDNLTVTLPRNFNVRERPAPAENLTCGAGVGIVVEGVVSVPFTRPEDDPEDDFIGGRSSVPGNVDTDTPAEASIPGRFKFTVDLF